MSRIKNEKDKNKTIIALKIGICVLVVLNIAIFLYFYCHSETILIKSESLVLTIVGILAAFVVISNYSQVLSIKNETREYIEKIEKEFENIDDKIKKQILDIGDILVLELEKLKKDIATLQAEKHNPKKEYNIVKTLENQIPKFYKSEKANIGALELILNLLNFDNNNEKTYYLNHCIYKLSIRFFELELPPNYEKLALMIIDKFNDILIDAVNNKYDNLVFNRNLYYANGLFKDLLNNKKILKIDFYEMLDPQIYNKMSDDYKELYEFYKSEYNGNKFYAFMYLPKDYMRQEKDNIEKRIEEYIDKCEGRTKKINKNLYKNE